MLNLAAHLAVLATWLPGRKLLSGREAGPLARSLTIAKDVLIGSSLATNFDVPGGSLEAALNAYAIQSGVQLMIPADSVP